MKFKNMNVLNEVVLDYDNPQKIYNLAREYDKLEQGAAAFSWYLRAADMSPGVTSCEKWLQYKCMIFSAFIYERNPGRNHSVDGLYKIAIETMPERPEAYYYMAEFKKKNNDWREALMYSAIGISNSKMFLDPMDDNDLNFPGVGDLELIYANAKWKTDGRDSSKNLAFDIKYRKEDISEELDMKATDLLSQHGYPSTLPYTYKDYDSIKYDFHGLDMVDKNYSRHFQDLFVLAVLDGKENGTYIELGSGHPELFNNTKLLEEEFDWKGLSVDNSERMCHIFSRKRSSNVLLADAAEIDYKSLFKQHCFEQRIDFLRINAETASVSALENIPFNKYEFNVIQFQHNAAWWGEGFKKASREILSKIGYVLFVSDVGVNNRESYEDWWVHPDVARNKANMKSINKINFAWDYMMGDYE